VMKSIIQNKRITCASVNAFTVPLFGVELVKHWDADSLYWHCLPESPYIDRWYGLGGIASESILVPSADCLTIQEWIFDLVEKLNSIR
jgi:hypothetical protein